MVSNTVLLWKGASAHNGEPILVFLSGLTQVSKNPKTGNMLTTWILSAEEKPTEAVKSGKDEAICGNCPNRPLIARSNGGCVCYVNHIPLNNIWSNWANGKTPPIDRKHWALVEGRSVRLGGYGDPTMVPIEVTMELLGCAKKHTGYTSQWREQYAQTYCSLLQASCNNDEQRDLAKSMGWRTYTHYPTSTTLSDKPGVICPNYKDKELTCQVCGLCNGSRSDVVIHDHGLNWKVRKH